MIESVCGIAVCGRNDPPESLSPSSDKSTFGILWSCLSIMGNLPPSSEVGRWPAWLVSIPIPLDSEIGSGIIRYFPASSF